MVWYHAKCVDINMELYRHQQKCVNLYWYCGGCNKGVRQVTEEICRIKQQQEQRGFDVIGIKEDIKLMKADTETLKKPLREETDFNDKKLKQNADKIITTVHNLLDTRLRVKYRRTQ